MAKGLRSSKIKANRAGLRSTVFGPTERARKERLSAKLLEIAAKPKPSATESKDTAVEENVEGEDTSCWPLIRSHPSYVNR